MSESMIAVIEPTRRRGRPRAKHPKNAMTVWVPTSYHDRIARLAIKHDVSVSKVVCKLLADALKTA